MPTAKPCLGYNTRTEAVIALRQQQVPDREIAQRIGISPSTVSALAASATRTGKKDRNAHAVDIVHTGIVLPMLTRMALRKPAAERGLSVDRLAILIVETVADSGLVDAVLDDRATGEIDVRPAPRGCAPAKHAQGVRPDSPSCPEGGSVNASGPAACEPPRSGTDRNIRAARETAPERVIAAPATVDRAPAPAASRWAAAQKCSAAIAFLRNQRISVSVASTGVFGTRWFVATYPGALDADRIVHLAEAKGFVA